MICAPRFLKEVRCGSWDVDLVSLQTDFHIFPIREEVQVHKVMFSFFFWGPS